MFRKILVSILFSLLQYIAFAQVNNVTVSFSPLTILEPDAGITTGFGFTFYKGLGFYADAGIIFYSPISRGDEEINNTKLGYKIKPALRCFVNQKKVNEGLYLELEGLIKHVIFHRFDNVNILDANGNFAYAYTGGYDITKKATGLNFKVGTRLFTSDAKRFGFDLFAGLGFRKKNYVADIKGLPNGVSYDKDLLIRRQTIFRNTESSMISIPLGAKLIYRLK